MRHSPAEICARILTQLKRAADDYLAEPVTEAVISVPVCTTSTSSSPSATSIYSPGVIAATLGISRSSFYGDLAEGPLKH